MAKGHCDEVYNNKKIPKHVLDYSSGRERSKASELLCQTGLVGHPYRLGRLPSSWVATCWPYAAGRCQIGLASLGTG